MLKKIQKYILLNYPLIWNLKIIPILLTAIIGNVLTFVFGYFTTSIDFDRYNNSFESHFISTFAIYILVILILILWLVAISKNNAFKNYYPTNVKSLYLQWILIGVSIFSILLMPFCFSRGINTKIKSYITKQELVKEGEVLNMVKILLPTPDNYMNFYQEVPTEIYNNDHYYPKGPNNTNNYYMQRDSLFFNSINSSVNYEDYPNFSQFSLLNYNIDEYSYNSLLSELKSFKKGNLSINIRDENTVKDWLITEKTDSIKNLMSAFINIQQKYNVSCNLTTDKWFALFYNPPKYVINIDNLIADIRDKDVSVYGYTNTLETNPVYHVNYYRLSSNIQKIAEAYNNSGLTYLLSLLYATLILTMLTFAFRVTSGKDWLIALVSLGIFSLIVWILIFGISILLDEFASYGAPIIYILLFIVELFYIYNCKYRGYSGVLVNHVIGFLPIAPLLILTIITISVNRDTRDIITDNILYYFSANLLLTLITMPLMTKLIIKWKGIPEN